MAIGELREQFKAKRYVTMNLSSGKARTLDQNAISHTWYERIAAELREDTALGVQSFCKLHFGVPILRTEDADFREKYDAAVKPMTYVNKLILMEWFPVTSLMKTPQLTQYLEAMRPHYGPLGVHLQFPNSEYKAVA